MDNSNNLQMIHEQEGENFNVTQDLDNPGVDAEMTGGDINFIQQQQSDRDKVPSVEYDNDEEELACGRFPHLDVCACDISCQIALKEINLFQVYPGIYMGPY